MKQVFPPSADTWLRLAASLFLLLVLGGAALGAGLLHSQYNSRVALPPQQPVPFSHEHHVSVLGIDCRYCHNTVETSAHAGLPPTHTCMTCHSQLFTGAPMLAPVRHSLATDVPLHWQRVSPLPDFVYFNHSIHIAKGVGCVSCHGRIDRMPLTQQAKAFTMEFCLSCHRNPAPHLRPLDRVTDMEWRPPGKDPQFGSRLMATRHIDPARITDCYTCHR